LPKSFLALCFAVFALLLIVSRWPLTPRQLFSWDDVNFAYAIGKFDIRANQPQPPGYPVFVLETRILNRLRVKQPDINFRILALLGSIAAVWLLFWAGNLVLGGNAGFWAACLMLFHPSFWFAGITSPVRVQLAMVSLGVAGACWQGMKGPGPWLYWSAIALGIGAGIRPELGPLLLPLWLWSVLRGEPSWPRRIAAGGVLTVAVLAWLVPLVYSASGLVAFFRTCWLYLSDQASLTSGLFGADSGQVLATLCYLAVWAGSGVLAYTLPALLAWKRQDGFGFNPRQIAFLLIWILPLAGFALLVHIGDPGHALAMVPVVCLVGGRLIDRAVQRWTNELSRFELVSVVGLLFGLQALFFEASHLAQFLLLPVLGLAAGAVRLLQRRYVPGWLPLWQAGVLLLLPSLCLDAAIFLGRGWYYPAPHAGTGIQRFAEQVWSDTNAAATDSNLSLIRQITDLDDHVIRQVRAWVAERPGNTFIVWADGPTIWAKVAYYLPETPVFAVALKAVSPGAPVALVLAKGSRTQVFSEGHVPLELRVGAGARLIWILGRRSGLDGQALARLGAVCSGPLCYNDLPDAHGSQPAGPVTVVW
jgi:hypothetical protein